MLVDNATLDRKMVTKRRRASQDRVRASQNRAVISRWIEHRPSPARWADRPAARLPMTLLPERATTRPLSPGRGRSRREEASRRTLAAVMSSTRSSRLPPRGTTLRWDRDHRLRSSPPWSCPKRDRLRQHRARWEAWPGRQGTGMRRSTCTCSFNRPRPLPFSRPRATG